MNEQGVGVDSAQLTTASSAALPSAVGTLGLAGGYPTSHPGLCAYCRFEPML